MGTAVSTGTRRYQSWSDRDIEYVLENWWDKDRRADVAKQLNRSIPSVNQKFYEVLREKKMSTKEYYRFYREKNLREANKASNATTASSESTFELFGASSPESSRSETSSNGSYHLINIADHPSFHQNDDEDRVQPITSPPSIVQSKPLFDEPVQHLENNSTIEPENDEGEVSFEELPKLIYKHDRKLKTIEAKMQGVMTVREFAAFFTNLDAAYSQIEQLQQIILEQEETIEDLESKLKRERERIKVREDELRNALDAINARLAAFLEKRPHEKIQDFAHFQEDLRSTVQNAEFVVAKRYAI